MGNPHRPTGNAKLNTWVHGRFAPTAQTTSLARCEGCGGESKWASIPLSGGESPLGLDPLVAAAVAARPTFPTWRRSAAAGPHLKVFFRVATYRVHRPHAGTPSATLTLPVSSSMLLLPFAEATVAVAHSHNEGTPMEGIFFDGPGSLEAVTQAPGWSKSSNHRARPSVVLIYLWPTVMHHRSDSTTELR